MLRQLDIPSTSAPSQHEQGRQGVSRHRCRRDLSTRVHKSEDFSLWRGETPVPKGWSPAVVPGIKTVATPLLSADKVGFLPINCAEVPDSSQAQA